MTILWTVARSDESCKFMSFSVFFFVMLFCVSHTFDPLYVWDGRFFLIMVSKLMVWLGVWFNWVYWNWWWIQVGIFGSSLGDGSQVMCPLIVDGNANLCVDCLLEMRSQRGVVSWKLKQCKDKKCLHPILRGILRSKIWGGEQS